MADTRTKAAKVIETAEGDLAGVYPAAALLRDGRPAPPDAQYLMVVTEVGGVAVAFNITRPEDVDAFVRRVREVQRAVWPWHRRTKQPNSEQPR